MMNKEQAIEMLKICSDALQNYGPENAKPIAVRLFRQYPATRWTLFTFHFWNGIDMMSKYVPLKMKIRVAGKFFRDAVQSIIKGPSDRIK